LCDEADVGGHALVADAEDRGARFYYDYVVRLQLGNELGPEPGMCYASTAGVDWRLEDGVLWWSSASNSCFV